MPLTAKDGELFQLDSYYRQLIETEREGINKLISSKLNIYKRELEIKWEKQINHAKTQEIDAKNQFQEFQQ